MPDYIYTRERIDSGAYVGSWDINNPAHQDSNGVPILLSEEIQSALPGWVFFVRCDAGQCVISSVTPLDSSEETDLNQVVADHKADRSGGQLQQKTVRGQYVIVPDSAVVPGVLGVLAGISIDLDELMHEGGSQLYQVMFEGYGDGAGAVVSLWEDGGKLGANEPIPDGTGQISFERSRSETGAHSLTLRAELGAATSAEVRYAVLTVFEVIPV